MDILERRGCYRVMVFIQFPPGLREQVGLAGMQLMIFLVSAWIQKVLDRALYSAAWLVAGPRGWQARSAFQALLSGTHLSRAGADWAQTLGPNHRLADELVSSHPAGLFCYWPTVSKLAWLWLCSIGMVEMGQDIWKTGVILIWGEDTWHIFLFISNFTLVKCLSIWISY